MVDTGSSWMWIDSYGAGGPDHSVSTYLFSEEKDSSLDCSSGRIETIQSGGRSTGVTGPVCEDFVEVYGSPNMVTRMPMVLRKGRTNPS